MASGEYAPLKLNGIATPFILTVTLNFALQQGQRTEGAS